MFTYYYFVIILDGQFSSDVVKRKNLKVGNVYKCNFRAEVIEVGGKNVKIMIKCLEINGIHTSESLNWIHT
jgi:hypothetical protein